MPGTDTGRVTAKEMPWANSATPKVIFAIASRSPGRLLPCARALEAQARPDARAGGRVRAARGDCHNRQPPLLDRQTALLFLVLSGGPGCGRFGLTFGGATAVTGLSPFAAGLGGKLWILREAALLIRHALAAFAARDSGELPILRETALRARDALAAFAARLGRHT